MNAFGVEKTPLVKIDNFDGLSLYAKLEYKQPSGSVKYRTASNMIKNAVDKGELKKGMTIIEQTSGNTGIAFAALGKKLGYPVIIVASNGTTPDAKRLIREYEAGLVEVEGWFAASEKKIREIIDTDPERYYWPQQISNPASLASNEALGNEIADELEPDIYLASMGTGSTITGVGRALKKRSPGTQVCLVLPDGEYRFAGVDDEADITVPMPLFDPTVADKEVRISETEAIKAAGTLHDTYGHYVGVSTGAVFAAAQKIAKEETGNAVMIFVDRGDRYTQIMGDE